MVIIVLKATGRVLICGFLNHFTDALCLDGNNGQKGEFSLKPFPCFVAQRRKRIEDFRLSPKIHSNIGNFDEESFS